VSVNHGCAYIRMAEEFLHRTDPVRDLHLVCANSSSVYFEDSAFPFLI
jgi:hypothetical protein